MSKELGVTTSLRKIAALSKPIRVVQGGQGSSKTYSILMLLINSCMYNENQTVSVFQAERTKMKRTVVRDFLTILQLTDNFTKNSWNKSDLIYTFPNGSYIEFLGLDASGIAKGFRRDIVYFNEANFRVNYETFTGLQSRATITYLDYNPDSVFWAHDELIDVREDVDFIILTFMDNEFLPDSEKRNILNYKLRGLIDPEGDPLDINNIKNDYYWNKWLVYGLGIVGKVSGTIITDWKTVDIIPKEAVLLGTGLDFGFAQDPTAIVNIYKLEDDTSILVDEVMFKKGMSISEIAAYLTSKEYGTLMCDAAEPRSIAELKKYGFKAKGVKKGAGSVSYGLDLLRSRTIYVTAKSNNIIDAFNKYSWDTDREGVLINKPNHYMSDVVDAIRYGVVGLIGLRRSGKYARPLITRR